MVAQGASSCFFQKSSTKLTAAGLRVLMFVAHLDLEYVFVGRSDAKGVRNFRKSGWSRPVQPVFSRTIPTIPHWLDLSIHPKKVLRVFSFPQRSQNPCLHGRSGSLRLSGFCKLRVDLQLFSGKLFWCSFLWISVAQKSGKTGKGRSGDFLITSAALDEAWQLDKLVCWNSGSLKRVLQHIIQMGPNVLKTNHD